MVQIKQLIIPQIMDPVNQVLIACKEIVINLIQTVAHGVIVNQEMAKIIIMQITMVHLHMHKILIINKNNIKLALIIITKFIQTIIKSIIINLKH